MRPPLKHDSWGEFMGNLTALLCGAGCVYALIIILAFLEDLI